MTPKSMRTIQHTSIDALTIFVDDIKTSVTWRRFTQTIMIDRSEFFEIFSSKNEKQKRWKLRKIQHDFIYKSWCKSRW